MDEETALGHIKYAYDAGINTFDTDNVCSNGLSEIILGNVIKRPKLPREELVIMTKVAGPVGPVYGIDIMANNNKPIDFGIINQQGLNRKHVFDSVKASLKRLQLDYIDALQCYRFDPTTPISEIMHALHDVVQAGYVRYIGMSSCWAWQFHAMQNHAINNNLTPFISMQNHYSLIYHEEERGMFPTLKRFSVGAIPRSPLGRGLLTRPWNEGSLCTKTDPFQKNYKGEDKAIVDRVEELSEKKGITMAQVALAWTLAKDDVVAPIIGISSIDNLKDLISAAHIKLTENEVKFLEEPYAPQAIVRHA